MGNKCTRPKNGLLQSVWRPRRSAPASPSAGDASDAGASDHDASPKPSSGSAETTSPTASSTVQDSPPVQITTESEPGPPEPQSPPQEEPPQPQLPPEEESPPEDNQPSTAATTTTTPDILPKTTPDEPEGPKKPEQVKRIASMGVQLESVLGRKTGNIKEVYILGRKLGQGQFGTTFLCTDKATGTELACKSIAKRKLLTIEDVEDVRREIQIMHHLAGHPNVIQIVGAYEDALAVHVVMDLCAGGELFDRIIQRGHYTERKAAELARVIVNVVVACHSLGVMHRDLKPENFLFVSHQEDALLKTIDFGLSMFFKPGETYADVVGSPYYVAPEVLRKHYGPECDIWSAGIIIYILLSGVPPFWDETEQGIFEQVLRGELDFISEPWPSISYGAKDLVSKMLERDPTKRLTAHQVLCHPWVQVDGDAPDKPIDSAVISRLKQFSAMNKLKKMAIRVIAENLSEEEIAGLKQMFKMIDADNSGQITLEELKSGLEKFGTNLKDSELLDMMHALRRNRCRLRQTSSLPHPLPALWRALSPAGILPLPSPLHCQNSNQDMRAVGSTNLGCLEEEGDEDDYEDCHNWVLGTCITTVLPPALTLEHGLAALKDAIMELELNPPYY